MGLENNKTPGIIGFKALGSRPYTDEFVSLLGDGKGPDGYADANESPEAVASKVVAAKQPSGISSLFGWAKKLGG